MSPHLAWNYPHKYPPRPILSQPGSRSSLMLSLEVGSNTSSLGFQYSQGTKGMSYLG